MRKIWKNKWVSLLVAFASVIALALPVEAVQAKAASYMYCTVCVKGHKLEGKCDACKGKGYVACSRCSGSGKEKCGACRGKGGDCFLCVDGWGRCHNQLGDFACMGGYLPCNRCMGTGACPRCDGTMVFVPSKNPQTDKGGKAIEIGDKLEGVTVTAAKKAEYDKKIAANRKLVEDTLAEAKKKDKKLWGKVPKVAEVSLSCSGKKSIDVGWEWSHAVDGYEIYTSGKKKGTYKKAAAVDWNTNRKTLDKQKNGKKVWVKIRAFRTVNDVTYYSSYSVPKAIVVGEIAPTADNPKQPEDLPRN